MAHPMEVTDATFDEEVLNSDIPVLVDFWAEWCGPCKMIAPIVSDLSEEYEGRMKVTKLDVDANPQAALKYGVRGIPTLLIFKGGSPVDQIVGRSAEREAQGSRGRGLERLNDHLKASRAGGTLAVHTCPMFSLEIMGADGLRWALRSSKSLVPVLPPGRWVRLPRAPARSHIAILAVHR